MNIVSRGVFVLFAIVAVTLIAHSQGATTIPDQVKKLYKFIGNWEGEGNMALYGKSHKMSMKHANTMVASGWGVNVDEISNTEGMGEYHAANILGYDSKTDTYHAYAVDNKGSVHDYHGKWDTDSSLVLEDEGTMKGKKLQETITVTFSGDDSYRFTIHATLDGKEMENAEAVVHKVK